MCRKFLYGVVMLALSYFPSYAHASGSFLEWRPFTVRDDLVLRKSEKINRAVVTQEILDEYLAGIRNYGGLARKEGDKKEEKKWDEYQYGSFLLRFSRFHDWTSSQEIVRPKEGAGLWETMKSFSSQWEGTPNRDTLESMGRIFTPEFELGIEF